MRSLWIILSLLLILFPEHSLGLKTAYVTFETPDGWKCELAQGVWLCQSKVEPARKQSLVLSIAATATNWDSLDNYFDYLKKTRRIKDETNRVLRSEISYVRKRLIQGHEWVDSLQFNSEIPGFWTRYLATVSNTKKARLAILITYIVSEEGYSKLSGIFDRMVSSLRLNNDLALTTPKNVPSIQGNKTSGTDILGKNPEILKSMNQVNTKDLMRSRLQRVKKKPASNLPLVVMLLAAAVIVFVFLKRRKKEKQPSQSTAVEPKSKS